MLATAETRDEAALLQVSQDMGTILVQGIRAASVVPTFFSQVAASMLGIAATRSSALSTHESYTHELRREGRQMVLRRVRIDCGFAHR
jgi:hypothetical protein